MAGKKGEGAYFGAGTRWYCKEPTNLSKAYDSSGNSTRPGGKPSKSQVIGANTKGGGKDNAKSWGDTRNWLDKPEP